MKLKKIPINGFGGKWTTIYYMLLKIKNFC